MPDSLSIPLQVYGIGFVISFGIAVLIKVMHLAISKLSQNAEAKKNKI